MAEPAPTAGGQIDLARFNLSQGNITVSPDEHPDDRALRLSIERRESWIRQGKDIVASLLVVAALILLAWVAYRTAFLDTRADADSKRWALTVLSSIATGAVSFLAGLKIGGK